MKDREELQEAYTVLVSHNLWRRGAIEGVEPNNPQEIGDALDTACGVLWEVINDVQRDDLQERLKKAEAERDQARKELADLWKQCRDTLAEDDHVDPTL